MMRCFGLRYAHSIIVNLNDISVKSKEHMRVLDCSPVFSFHCLFTFLIFLRLKTSSRGMWNSRGLRMDYKWINGVNGNRINDSGINWINGLNSSDRISEICMINGVILIRSSYFWGSVCRCTITIVGRSSTVLASLSVSVFSSSQSAMCGGVLPHIITQFSQISF